MPEPPLELTASALGLNPDAGSVDLLQTHIGWVYVCGEHAFKLKKHVRFDFLDFSNLAARRWACEREIVLNRRLVPDLYHGLVPVVETSSARRLDLQRLEANVAPTDVPSASCTEAPEIVDWAVWMKRLPADRMLDRLLERASVSTAQAEQIADVLASFYIHQRAGRRIAPGGLGDLDAVTFNVEENLREAERLDRALLPAGALRLIAMRARHFLKKYGGLVQQRARDGFVVDGHGDLRAENICLPQNAPPVLFDCIEFNDRFRVCDSCLDVAFLAMDLESRGREDLSAAFLRRYRERCDPRLPRNLLDFYLGYRAFVKAKVAAWIAADGAVALPQRQESACQSRALFDLGVRYAVRGEPVLLVFCGPAGSGKSTLARELARRLRARHLSTDLLRDEIVPRGLPTEQRYTSENSWKVYTRLFELAATALQEQRTVILDGTFSSASLRKRAAEMAGAAGAQSVLIWADAPLDTAEQHLRERLERGDLHGSEAGLDVSRRQHASFARPSLRETRKERGGFGEVCRIDTGQSIERSHEQTWDAVLNALSHTADVPPA